jgi:hypothetical protein
MSASENDDVSKRTSPPRIAVLLLCALLLNLNLAHAQEQNEPGRSIGKVSLNGDLIIVELNDAALGSTNTFDLVGRTLRFTPQRGRYLVDSGPLRWDSDPGPEAATTEITLRQFAFPFSGKPWNSFLVGTTGSIRFGKSQKDIQPDAYGKLDGGLSLDRFDQLAQVASTLIESAPAICVFLKPRMSGPHYVKELPDRVVITWNLTEPYGSLLDFSWFKTVNQFQAVLHRDGAIEMSYKELSAKDAIVGLYPRLSRTEKSLTTITSQPHPSLPPRLDVQKVKLSILDDSLLRVTFETRGPVPAEGDPAMDGIGYRVDFAAADTADAHSSRATWTIQGMKNPYNPSAGPATYSTSGLGTSPKVTISGNSIAIEGVLPAALTAAAQVAISAEVFTAGEHAKVVERLPNPPVRFSRIRSPEVHLSSLTRKDGPFPFVFESFHYLAPPNPEDLSCTVINALGDKFDFLAYYSDFRVDNQEGSSPSFGPAAGNIPGIGQTQNDQGQNNPDSYCGHGKFQWAFAQPVYVGSNEMQAEPPATAPAKSNRDITFYVHQLAEGSPYNYAIAHLGHEMAHRWAAYVSAKINGETIPLGPWPHWAQGLQAPVAFPYSLPTESSTLGGGVWQDNFNGTYTQLRDGYLVPAAGYSYLDLYLMGFISATEVPDFFLLKNLAPAGKDANGHPIFKAERTKITIQDVIAAQGPRLPDVDHSRRKFNTGIVILTEHRKKPSAEILKQANGIRQQWLIYWQTTTGHRASMTITPQ